MLRYLAIILLVFQQGTIISQIDDKQLFLESMEKYAEKKVVFDSILKNYDEVKTAQLKLASFDTFYFYSDKKIDFINSDFYKQTGFKDKKIITINDQWLDSIDLNLGYLQKTQPKYKFNGAIVFYYSYWKSFSWAIYENSYTKERVSGRKRKIKGVQFPDYYKISLQNNLVGIYKWGYKTYEQFFIENQPIEKFKFIVLKNYSLIPKKQDSYLYLNDKTILIFHIYRKIKFFKVLEKSKSLNTKKTKVKKMKL